MAGLAARVGWGVWQGWGDHMNPGLRERERGPTGGLPEQDSNR